MASIPAIPFSTASLLATPEALAALVSGASVPLLLVIQQGGRVDTTAQYQHTVFHIGYKITILFPETIHDNDISTPRQSFLYIIKVKADEKDYRNGGRQISVAAHRKRKQSVHARRQSVQSAPVLTFSSLFNIARTELLLIFAKDFN